MKRGFPTTGMGFRSQLEEKIAAGLDKARLPYEYEESYLVYEIPASLHKYNPDFVLHNGIIVEAKGLFDVDDRKKHLLIKKQYPDLDIRFVFSSSRTKISAGSKTTVGEWCEKHGYKFADKVIPTSWLREKGSAIPEGVLIKKKNKED